MNLPGPEMKTYFARISVIFMKMATILNFSSCKREPLLLLVILYLDEIYIVIFNIILPKSKQGMKRMHS